MLDLSAPHFYRSPDWPAKTIYCSDSALARLRGGQQYEGDVSRTLSFFTGDFADALAGIFLDFGRARTQSADAELWVGHEWLAASGSRPPGDRRSPDIIVTMRSDLRHVLLVIEVKGRAWVNGHSAYCPVHCKTLGYANQIICYADDCWTTANLNGVPRLVIGPDAHRHSFGGWGRKGLMPDDGPRHGLQAAFAAQQTAAEQWRFAGLRELVARIEQIGDSPARRDALEVLVGWLDRIGL